MPKRERDITDRNPLTPTEVAELACSLVGPGESEDTGALLLLCHAFAFEKDFTEREHMLHAITVRLAPYLEGFDAMQLEAMRQQVDILRDRAARKGDAR